MRVKFWTEHDLSKIQTAPDYSSATAIMTVKF